MSLMGGAEGRRELSSGAERRKVSSACLAPAADDWTMSQTTATFACISPSPSPPAPIGTWGSWGDSEHGPVPMAAEGPEWPKAGGRQGRALAETGEGFYHVGPDPVSQMRESTHTMPDWARQPSAQALEP
ncbi:hypothetical protein ACOMHN_004372 [Nucella lapillus]